ncbi:MAG TPA: PatB family C-S lyase, partial [Bacteroidales bacterium]|nr:PatB family C-S lyase [Bacteroidales bacterium]
ADMDFRSPEFIINALRKRLDHEILGYNIKPDGFYTAVIDWMKRRFNWDIQQDWISFTPGVVSALNFGVLSLTEPGQKVIIQTPVYAPFFKVVKNHNRQLIINELKLQDGRYIMDLENIESQIDKDTKAIILCSPANPAGRVWSKDELLALGDICLKHNLLIISDEIHSDLILKGHQHLPLASLSKELANITVTCMAPSKTFNIAGLASSVIITPNPELKQRFEMLPNSLDLNNGNLFGIEALQTAYTKGDEWLTQMLAYLDGNIDFLESYINQYLPKIKMIRPEGTYLVWLDCRGMNMSQPELRRFFTEKAKVGLNNGSDFGPGGEGFMRMNVGCPRSIIAEGLARIKQAMNQ